MKNIIFKSPVNKGENFSFGDLFNIDENQQAFNEYVELEVKNKFNMVKDEKTNAIRNELQKDFDIRVREAKLDATAENQKEILSLQSQLKTIESSDSKEIAHKNEMIQSVQEQNLRLNNNFDTIKESYSEKLQEVVQKLTSEKEQELSALEAKYTVASKIGLDAEQDIQQLLRNQFSSDQIEIPNHAIGGADLHQTIMLNGKKLGSILYEVKNRKTWQSKEYDNFIAKTQKESDDFNVFVAKSLPKSKTSSISMINESLFYDKVNNVYVTSFDNFLSLVFALRNTLMHYSAKINAFESADEKSKELYEFIVSPDFANYFARVDMAYKETRKTFDEITNLSIKGISSLAKINVEVLKLKDTTLSHTE